MAAESGKHTIEIPRDAKKEKKAERTEKNNSFLFIFS